MHVIQKPSSKLTAVLVHHLRTHSHTRACPGPTLQGWARFTTGAFSCRQVEGNHLWPLDREAKRAWLEAIAVELGRLAQ